MISQLKDRWQHMRVTLRFSILLIFVTLFVLTTLIIIIVRTISYTNALSYTSLRLMKTSSLGVLRQLSIGSRAETAVILSRNLLESGVLKDEIKPLSLYTYHLVNTLPLAKGAFYGDEKGNFVYTEKENDGTIKIDIFNRRVTPATRVTFYRNAKGDIVKEVNSLDFTYDPRLRPWYIKAKEQRKLIWTNLFTLADQSYLAIATAIPVYQNGRFAGVFGIDITLDYLQQFVSNHRISKHGFTFVIAKNGDLIAFPNIAPFDAFAHSNQIINVYKADLPLIRQSLDYFKRSGDKTFTILHHKPFLVAFEPVPAFAENQWMVGAIVPKSDFIGGLQTENLITLGISSVILLLGIMLVSRLISRVVKPINQLAHETDKIKNFELGEPLHIPSRIKEIVTLTRAINSMKLGLKQFQKYVPKILVRQLIESGEDVRIGGVRKQLVVFFSDIKNFTSIAETMDPSDLTNQLCEYFEELSKIIIQEKGTIDKYIGDAIMAFWGAPLPEKEPCVHSARAALRIQDRLKELNNHWKDTKKPILITRIGIHVGDAIVGNVGSTERFSYTAIGDTINVTNRLEEINKIYKTNIMVSEPVYQIIKDSFVLRFIDRIAVKGRKEISCIYELLSDDIHKVPFDIITYNNTFTRGFGAYTQQEWNKALLYFKECLQIYPEDTIAPIFIERCLSALAYS